MRTHLLLIDPQNDFCDLPADWLPLQPQTRQPIAPALPVAGAHADMLRTAALVQRLGNALDGITVTLDSHHRIDIAHPGFWRRADGAAVSPFTPITAAQVRKGEFLPRDAALLQLPEQMSGFGEQGQQGEAQAERRGGEGRHERANGGGQGAQHRGATGPAVPRQDGRRSSAAEARPRRTEWRAAHPGLNHGTTQ